MLKKISKLLLLFLFLFETISCGEAILSGLQQNTDSGPIKCDLGKSLKDDSVIISKPKHKIQKTKLFKKNKNTDLLELLEEYKNEIETLRKQNLDLKNRDSADQELIRQKNKYSAHLNTQLDYQKELYQKSLDEQSAIKQKLTAAHYEITNLKQGSTKPRFSKFTSFVLPIGLVLTALLGMGAGVVFSDAIKNLLAVLLKRA